MTYRVKLTGNWEDCPIWWKSITGTALSVDTMDLLEEDLNNLIYAEFKKYHAIVEGIDEVDTFVIFDSEEDFLAVILKFGQYDT